MIGFTKIVAVLLTAVAVAKAQADAPAPSAFASAHSAFLAFASAPTVSDYDREQTRLLYNTLFEAIQSAGRYEMVTEPSKADLCMEFAIMQNPSFAGFRLAIYDCKVHALLWTLDQPISSAFRTSTVQKHMDAGIAQLLADLKTLAAGNIPRAVNPKYQKP